MATWAQFQQYVFTNMPNAWDSLNLQNVTVVFYMPKFAELNLEPQLLKDFFQFDIFGSYSGMFVDLDFVLLDASKLPQDGIFVGTEVVRQTGAYTAKELVRAGVRGHLGITMFPCGSSLAARIAENIASNLKGLVGIKKGHAKWMTNTKTVQKILLDYGYTFTDPILTNPFPVYLKKMSSLGGMLFGGRIPTIQEVLDQSATYTIWSGYKFPALEIMNEATFKLDIPMPRFAVDAINIPVPDDGTSLTTYYYYSFCICPIQMN